MIVIIMGVCGAGKTIIGKLLAQRLNWQFHDADDFHALSNITKMQAGIALSDADREPWLQNLRDAIAQWLQAGSNIVLACSALKAKYREYLLLDRQEIELVYLKGSFELLNQRLLARHHHFMSPNLLESQLETLEEQPQAIYIDIAQPPEAIVQYLLTTGIGTVHKT